MKLHSIFVKPVDRHIEGVIKADDDTSLQVEIDEYVLTNEVEQRLETFLDAYNNYEGANGVWISGFFGCGKSHLLKMLALLLSNRQIPNIDIAESFASKCGNNKLLAAAIKKAVKTPSQSILFNIDQKADVISKSQVDALLSVFMKVFDESCGYYGKQGYIANFERKLDEDGLLDKFKAAFDALESNGWEWGRQRVDRMSAKIDKAYGQATDASVNGIMDRFKADYKVSIEDFADIVKTYIDRQDDKNFRLNFFVDEVGQYIAENTKLMTNLQTIAESLATKCKGKAWVIVTAQEDMNTIVGEMGKQQGNDFSKIKARFANSMKLTSQDVAEVIQKRLLAKTTDAEPELAALYEEEQNNFQTLFDFSDGGQTYRNFRDKDHFVNCYPFIPYQFELFQLAIRSFSKQNAFEGKHRSVGERSMLGVFQEVAVQISDHEIGELATFDLMFEGIRTALKSQIQSSIAVAENNLENRLAVRLLKALFLVKYVREFKPTLRNLCVLMQDSFSRDLPQLRKDMEEALNLLESQIYIQRNGEVYDFLTDEEKDVAQEIKNTEVDASEVAEELAGIIFDQVIKSKKLRYDETKQDYSFTRKLDDRLFGREHELSVHVVSPFHNDFDRIDNIKMQAMGRAELLVVLPADVRLMQDITLYKQTAKYVGQNISVTQQESLKRILHDKTSSNKDRGADILQSVQQQLGNAQMFVANAEVESSSHDAQMRVHDGFESLIVQTYTNLKLLRGVVYREDDIERCLTDSGNDLFGGDATAMSEAETEMLASINRKSQKGITTTVKTVMEEFEHKPFGWYYAAILCVLAKLCGRGKVEARSDSESLEDKQLLVALKNTKSHGNVVLEPQIEFTASQVRRVKDFYQAFFDRPPSSSEAKSLASQLASSFQELHQELTAVFQQSSTFPFVSVLSESLQQLKELGGKSTKYFFTEFEVTADDLLDLKEDTLDPMRVFMSGPASKLYAEARTFLADQKANLLHVADPAQAQLKAILDDPRCYVSDGIQEAKGLLLSLQKQVQAKVKAELAEAEKQIQELENRIKSIAGYNDLNDEQKSKVAATFEQVVAEVKRQPLVAVVRDSVDRFKEDAYPQLLSSVEKWLQPDSDSSGGVGPVVTVVYVAAKDIHVEFDKPWLDGEEDVDRYQQSQKAAMMEEIKNGKRIQI